jgi:hypothetical protein
MGGVEARAWPNSFLISAVVAGERSASSSRRFRSDIHLTETHSQSGLNGEAILHFPPLPTRGGCRDWCKLPGPISWEGGPDPQSFAYIFVFLGVIRCN